MRSGGSGWPGNSSPEQPTAGVALCVTRAMQATVISVLPRLFFRGEKILHYDSMELGACETCSRFQGRVRVAKSHRIRLTAQICLYDVIAAGERQSRKQRVGRRSGERTMHPSRGRLSVWQLGSICAIITAGRFV